MDTQQQYGRLIYTPTIPIPQPSTLSHSINASMNDSSWHHTSQSSSPSSSSSSDHSSHVFSLNHSPDHVDYTNLATPFIPQHESTHYHDHSPDSHSLDHDMSAGLTQVESSIGPTRVLTRRQRALLQQSGRRVSDSSSLSSDSTQQNVSSDQQSMFFIPSPSPRSQTPSHVDMYPSQSDTLPLSSESNTTTPRYSSGPGSEAQTFSPYTLYPTHSRSTSTSDSNPRSASPALSVASALTSVSSASAQNPQSFTPFPLPTIGSISTIVPRQKQRKQRLFNVDRKAICVYHKQYPNARQEDIAVRYGVERSTISKILKHKTKWLNVPEHEDLRVAKHRPSKFPALEAQLQKWLVETRKNNVIMTDAMIRQRAKDMARCLEIPDEKFKASSGWVENFKHRHGIRGGVWHGDGRNTRIARAVGAGTFDTLASPESPFIPNFATRQRAAMDSHPIMFHDSMSVGIRPEGPQGTEMGLRRNPALDSPMSLQHSSSWHRHSEESSPTSLSMTSMSRPRLSPIHESGSQSPLARHHHESAMHLDHIPLSSHEQPDAHHDPATAYASLEMYQSVRPMSPHEPPTLADAEEAINKVISYIESQGSNVLSPEERRNLDQIKSALFQAGN